MFFKSKTSKTGDVGEKTAAEYLKKKGYKILEFNYKNPSGRRLGEIDVIAKEGNTIVFVEVKTRVGDMYLSTLPEENINRAKLYKLSKIATFYLRSRGLDNASYRFDAISVWLSDDQKTIKIKHIESMFL